MSRTALPALVLLTLLSAAGASHAGDRVVARVESKPITHRMVLALQIQAPDTGYRQALNSLIESRLVLLWAEQNSVEVTDMELERIVASIRDRNNLTQRQFEEALAAQGQDPEGFRESLREQVTVSRATAEALARRADISDEEIEEVYRRQFQVSYTLSLRHILLTVDSDAGDEGAEAVREEAVRILDEIANGRPFEEAAAEYSDDPLTADNGGDLGSFDEGELLPELEDEARSLEPGEVGGPVRTAAGYHLILVTDRDSIDPPPLDDVREDLKRSILVEREQSLKGDWLKELREEYYVEIFPGTG